jgi:hypothetical protein
LVVFNPFIVTDGTDQHMEKNAVHWEQNYSAKYTKGRFS